MLPPQLNVAPGGRERAQHPAQAAPVGRARVTNSLRNTADVTHTLLFVMHCTGSERMHTNTHTAEKHTDTEQRRSAETGFLLAGVSTDAVPPGPVCVCVCSSVYVSVFVHVNVCLCAHGPVRAASLNSGVVVVDKRC